MALEKLTIYNFTPDEIWMEQFVVAVCRAKKGRIKSREVPVNKKRKVLTLAALAVFGAIIGLHYMPIYQHSYSDWHLINPTEAALHWPHYLPSDYEKVVWTGRLQATATH